MGRFSSKKIISGETVAEPDTFRPQMTSLIDILTLLLVFLIQSFSAEGNLITASEDLQLPTSTSKEAPKPALIVEITQKAIISDGRVIASVDSVMHSPALLINNLYAMVMEKKRTVADTSKSLEAIIECDKEMQFSIVKRVMFTCSKAGYSDFSILAVEGD